MPGSDCDVVWRTLPSWEFYVSRLPGAEISRADREAVKTADDDTDD